MIKGGPKIIDDNLVVCLDAHDAKSYAGEPTTNLVTSSAIDFTEISAYTNLSSTRVTDDESPSGYACEMYESAEANAAARSLFGSATNIPTSGTGFVSVWVKQTDGSANIRPYVYSGLNWYVMVPLDGGSQYITNKYRPFGVSVTFGTNSGGPNPGFNMTRDGTSVANEDIVRWIKPQVTTLSYNTPFANLSRSATNGWVDRSGNSNSGTLVNGTNTGVSHYRDGQVIMPVANSYLDFDGSDDKVDCGSVTPDTGDFTIEFIYQLTGNGGRGGLFERKAGSPYNGFSFGQGGSGDWSFTVSGTSNYSGGSYLKRSWTYPTLNTWYNDVGVYSGGNSVSIYRNGLLVSSTSGSAQGNLSTQGTRTNFLIANRDNSTSLPCKVGLVRVYNKALTAAEVLSNYNATKNRFT